MDIWKSIALIFVVLIGSGNANAALIEADLYTTGDALLTIDTDTSLEWLDLTESLYMSLTDVKAGAGGFMAAGFRYATGGELHEFVDNAGYDRLDRACFEHEADTNTHCFAVASNLLELMGCTQGCGSTTPLGRGMLDDDISVDYWSIDTVKMTGVVSGDIGFNGSAHSTTGSFLVRAASVPVPEPPATLLVGIGLVLLLRSRTRASARYQ